MESAELQQSLLADLRKGDRKAVKQLYELAYRYCTSFVLTNQGTPEDARETFQECLFVFLKKIKTNPGFHIKKDLKLYLYVITKFLWLKELKKHKVKELLIVDDPAIPINLNFDENDMEYKTELEEKYNALYDCLGKLGAQCQELIKLFYFQNEADQQIAIIMNYERSYVRTKRYRCIQKLRTCVDPN